MNFKAIAAVAIAAILAICLVPVAETEAVYSNVDGSSVIGTGNDADYTITYTNHDYDSYQDISMSISYEAKLVDSSGETVSKGVSPSSGDLDNGGSADLTVSAPDTAGRYQLIVTYDVQGSYTDENGDTVDIPAEDLAREDVFDIKVVVPITLSVTLTNESSIDLSGYGVYFYVNGERIDDSFTTVNLAGEGTTTVTYDWVADVGNGTYTFSVQSADGGNLSTISGLGEEHTFYIGDNSYTMWVALLVIVIILLALVIVWVYRKPVKNYGKPKSRR